MKNILLIILALAAMLFSCTSAGCVHVNDRHSFNQFGSRSNIKGSGNLVTRTAEIPAFRAINASRAVQVIVCDTTDRIVITADDNLIDYVETIVSREVLYVSIADSIKSFTNVHVVVVVPIGEKLTMLSASSAARIATAKALQAEKLKIAASSAARIRVAVSADKCVVDATSASRVELIGSADKFEADLSSASRIDAESLKTHICEVDASSSSKVTINCSEYLNADVSSAAVVNYKGDCRTDISTSSGGRVRHQ